MGTLRIILLFGKCFFFNYLLLFFRNASFTLQPLYKRIKSTFENEREPCLLIIDDLSCLLSIGIHVQNVIDFAHYCYSLMCCSTTMVGFKLKGPVI